MKHVWDIYDSVLERHMALEILWPIIAQHMHVIYMAKNEPGLELTTPGLTDWSTFSISNQAQYYDANAACLYKVLVH